MFLHSPLCAAELSPEIKDEIVQGFAYMFQFSIL